MFMHTYVLGSILFLYIYIVLYIYCSFDIYIYIYIYIYTVKMVMDFVSGVYDGLGLRFVCRAMLILHSCTHNN